MLASPPNCSLGKINMKSGVKGRPLKVLGEGGNRSLRRRPFVAMNRFYLDLSSDIRLMLSLFCWHKDHKDSAQEKKERKKKTCVDVEAEAKAQHYDSDIFSCATAAAAVRTVCVCVCVRRGPSVFYPLCSRCPLA